MTGSKVLVSMFALLVGASVFVLASESAAHHPRTPRPLSVTTFDGEEGTEWVLESTIGIVTSDAPTSFVCAEAFGDHANFRFHPMTPTTWVALTDSGLFVTRDGCTVEVLEEWIVFPLTSDGHRESMQVAYARPGAETTEITWVALGVDGGLASRESVVVDGRVTGLKFLDAERLIGTAITENNLLTGPAKLFVIELASGAVEVLTAPPWQVPRLLDARGEQLIWAARDGWEVRVAAGTLESPAEQSISGEVFPGAAILSKDGGEALVAGLIPVGRGLTRFATQGEPGRVDDYEERWIHCLAEGREGLYLCGDRYAVGYDLAIEGDGHEPAHLFDFWQLEGPRMSCPADSAVARVCPDAWELVVERLGEPEYPGGGEDEGDDVEVPEPVDVGWVDVGGGYDDVGSDGDEWWRDSLLPDVGRDDDVGSGAAASGEEGRGCGRRGDTQPSGVGVSVLILVGLIVRRRAGW